MTQYNIFLSEQEKDKLKMLKIMWNKNSYNEVFKQLIHDYNVKVEDKGFKNGKKSK